MKITKFVIAATMIIFICGCSSDSPGGNQTLNSADSSSSSAGYDLASQKTMLDGIDQIFDQFETDFDDQTELIDARLIIAEEYESLVAVDDWAYDFEVRIDAFLARVKSRVLSFNIQTNIDPKVVEEKLGEIEEKLNYSYETKFNVRFVNNTDQFIYLETLDIPENISEKIDTALVEINLDWAE